MDISNPMFRESIIAMDGEIVRPRIRTLGGMGGLTKRANELIWKDNSVDEYYMPKMLLGTDGILYQITCVPSPGWNMDTTPTLNVPHGLNYGTIWWVGGFLRGDIDTTRYPLTVAAPGIAGVTDLAIFSWDATNILLERRTGGIFDSVDFDDVLVVPRAWVMIVHTDI